MEKKKSSSSILGGGEKPSWKKDCKQQLELEGDLQRDKKSSSSVEKKLEREGFKALFGFSFLGSFFSLSVIMTMLG